MDDIMFKKCELGKLKDFNTSINELESVFKKVLSDNQVSNNRYLYTLNTNIQNKDSELRKLKAAAWDYILVHDGSILMDIENNPDNVELELDQKIHDSLCATKSEMKILKEEQDNLIHGCDILYNLIDELALFLSKDDKTVKNTKAFIIIPNICKIDKRYTIWNKNTSEIKMNLKTLFDALKEKIKHNIEILENDLIVLKAIEFDKLNIAC
tara:strand:+ start:718 stop:1350 length:633 start_codon:yes stop_codon:yes gene_type:complete